MISSKQINLIVILIGTTITVKTIIIIIMIMIIRNNNTAKPTTNKDIKRSAHAAGTARAAGARGICSTLIINDNK